MSKRKREKRRGETKQEKKTKRKPIEEPHISGGF